MLKAVTPNSLLEALMEVCVIQAIQYFTTDGIPKEGLEVEKHFRLSTDPELLEGTIEKYKYPPEAGLLEIRVFLENPTFAFALTRFKDQEAHQADAEAFLRVFAVRSQLLMLALWMVKDNSCNAAAAFLCVKDRTGLHYIGDRMNVVYFNTRCRFANTHFSETEFLRALEFYAHLERVIPKVEQRVDERRPTALTHASRVGRALYFVQAARTQNDIGLKAAFYSMAFESLFSTDMTGVNHRVAERTALLVTEPGQGRRDTYKDVHDLYNYRSAVVHGSPIREKDVEKVFQLTERCDTHLRDALTKIIEDPALADLFSKHDPDGIAKHFFERLFPVAHAASAEGLAAPTAEAEGPGAPRDGA